jgi:hypothetical protein
MQAFRKRTTTAAVVAVLAIAHFSGAQAQSVHADDRTYFASAASEQTARDSLGKRVEALQQASTLAPAERFQQAEVLEAQCLRHLGSCTCSPPATHAIFARHRRWSRQRGCAAASLAVVAPHCARHPQMQRGQHSMASCAHAR